MVALKFMSEVKPVDTEHMEYWHDSFQWAVHLKAPPLPLVSMSHTADTSWPVKLPLETKQNRKTFA